jgi:hypothetical protein
MFSNHSPSKKSVFIFRRASIRFSASDKIIGPQEALFVGRYHRRSLFYVETAIFSTLPKAARLVRFVL